jgi:hypothetical protein
MADKILRRTSYGGEQTDSLGKYTIHIKIYQNWNFLGTNFIRIYVPTYLSLEKPFPFHNPELEWGDFL